MIVRTGPSLAFLGRVLSWRGCYLLRSTTRFKWSSPDERLSEVPCSRDVFSRFEGPHLYREPSLPAYGIPRQSAPPRPALAAPLVVIFCIRLTGRIGVKLVIRQIKFVVLRGVIFSHFTLQCDNEHKSGVR